MSNYGTNISSSTLAPPPTLLINSNATLTSAAYGKSFKITGAYTVTLPTIISGSSGSDITFMNDSSSTVSFVCQGSDYVRVLGANTATLSLSAGDSVVLQNTGTTFSLADSNILKAPLNSPSFSGVPTAPTAALNTATPQIATTAFVIGQASGLTPSPAGLVGTAGSSPSFARGDHVHPPGVAGTAVTQSPGNNTPAVATTAFVHEAQGNFSGTTGYATSATQPQSDFGCVALLVSSASITLTTPTFTGVAAGNVLAYSNFSSVANTVQSTGPNFQGSGFAASTTLILPPATSVVAVYDGTSLDIISTGGFSVGLGQTWQNMLSSRALGGTYTNNTGRTIEVAISATCSSANGYTTGSAYVNGVTVGEWVFGGSTGTWTFPCSFSVPNGGVYSVSGGYSLVSWAELR